MPLVYCKDMSLNGTFLNDTLIGKHLTVMLTHGDQLSMCNGIQFTFYQRMLGDSDAPKSELSYMSGLELGDYRISNRIIGHGSFGEVRTAINVKTNQHVACKISKILKKKKFEPATEVNILSTLSHVC